MTVESITARQIFEDDHAEQGAPRTADRPRKVLQIDPEPPRRMRLRLAAIVSAVLAAAGALVWWLARPPLVEETLWTATVQSGELRVGVGGHGQLIPSGLQTLSTTTGGSVAAMHALPGASLQKGDLIVTLSNPEVTTELRAAEKAYSEKEGEKATLLSELMMNRSGKQAAVEDAKDALAIESLDLEAQSKLFEGGIISRIQLEKQRARVAATQRQVRQAEADLANSEMSHRIRAQVLDAAVQKAAAELELARGRVDGLDIRATESGTLQELMANITVGTPVAAGAVIAKIATGQEVIAELQIPSGRSGEIAIDQAVDVQAGDRPLTGRVQRVDPRVQQDQVRVSVLLAKEGVAGLLPGQPVSGEIITARLRNTLYLERPAGAADNAAATLFEVDRNHGRLLRRDVRLGQTGGRFIVVQSGLRPGAEVVLSDMTRFASHRRLRYDSRGEIR